MGQQAPMDNDELVPPEALSRLLSIALSRPDLCVLREMLLEVADQLDAYGCALWQTEPRLPGTRQRPIDEDPREEKILAIAAGFRHHLHYPEHDLPATIPSGRAMKEGVVAVPDLSRIELPERGQDFLRHTSIQSLCSVRVQLLDRRTGSLTVYRQRTG